MEDRNYKGHLVIFVAYVIFGLNIPIAKSVMASGYVPALALSYFRIAGAAVLFWAASLFIRRDRVRLKDLPMLALASTFAIIVNQMSFIVGLSKTSPIDASVITTLVPIFTMLLAAVFIKEPVTWKKTAGVTIGASGAIYLIYSGHAASGRDGATLVGNLLCILSSISYATYLAAFKNLIMRYHPVTLMKWMFLFAAAVCLPICYTDVAGVDYAAIPSGVYLGTAYVVVFATFISFLLVPIGQKLLRPTVVSMYNYVQPVIASLVAVAMGLDTFGWHKAGAAVLVFLGVYIVTISKSRAQVEAGKASGKK